jgi:hypothetical protein
MPATSPLSPPILVRLVALLAALFLVGSALAGCAHPTAAPGGPPAAPATPAPPVDTPDGYQKLLDQTNDELAAALAAVGAAPSLAALDQAVLTAAGVASSASERLTSSGPVPATVSEDNAALAGTLRQFGRELAYLSQQINVQVICAGPTALAAISSAPSMPALRAAAASLGTPRGDRPAYHWGSALPPATDAPRMPLRNGAVLVDRRNGASGDGVLRASNDGGADAVLLLARGGAVVVSLAVTAGQSAQLDGVPDGDYDLYYTAGQDWNAALATFSRRCEFHRFTTPTTFRTNPVPGGSAYTVQSIALHTPPQSGGGAPGDGPVPAGAPPGSPPPPPAPRSDAGAGPPNPNPETIEIPPDQMPR